MQPAHALPPFPAAQQAPFADPVLLRERGIGLRAAAFDDLDFLRRLYRALRADELAPVPWTDAAKQAFLDDQFALQHRHFVRHYPAAEFLLLQHAGVPIGRLYLLRQRDRDFHLVDIALLPAWRGQGIGAALIRCVQEQACIAGRAVTLYVDQRNVAARRLYERLGFRWVADEGPYRLMCWRSPALS